MSELLVVKNGAANLAARRTGAGPAVVLLHPGVADQRGWSDVAASLAHSHRVVTYDRRGFGATTYGTEPHTAIDDLIAVLDATGVERADIIANSMGCRIATDFALAAPNRVASLVLVAAVIKGAPPPTDIPSEVERLDGEIERLEDAGDVDGANELEARLWLDGPFRPAGHVGGRVRELFLEMNGVALRSAPTGEIDEIESPTAWDRLGQLTMPLLSLVGAHDLPHLKERMRAIAARVPGAEMAVLPNSAHLPQLDDPDTFADVVGTFIDRPRGG